MRSVQVGARGGRATDAHKDYSGTPLPNKLGIRQESRVLVAAAPAGFGDLLAPLPPGVELRSRAGGELDIAIVFVTRLAELTRRFPPAARAMAPDGRLWIAWPKKASQVETDLTFSSVQRVGLDAGLVDNKSASITDVYQGLQFVRRLKDRPR